VIAFCSKICIIKYTKGALMNFKKSLIKKFYILILLSLTLILITGCNLYTYVRFKFTYDTYYVNVGEKLKVTPYVEKGKNATLIVFIYTSDDKDIAEYKDKYIEGISEGQTTIRVIHKFDPSVFAEATIVVEDPEYQLTYDLKGGVDPGNPTTYKKSALPILLNPPTKEGQIFLGWYLYPTLQGKSITKLTIDLKGRDRVLYAKWGYVINYHLNGGVNNDDNPVTYASADLPVSIYQPTKDGYTFLGWYDNPTFTGESIDEIISGTTGDKSLYAKWE